jgi:hypothetical protein
MNPGLRGLTAENPHTTPGRRQDQFADLLAGNPMQTPPLRNTDHIPAYEQPEEKSIVGTVLAAFLMLGVIAFGAYKLKPVLYDMRQLETRSGAPSTPGPTPAAEAAPAGADLQPATKDPSTQSANGPAQSESAQPAGQTSSEAPTELPADQTSAATTTSTSQSPAPGPITKPTATSAQGAAPAPVPTGAAVQPTSTAPASVTTDTKPSEVVPKKIAAAKVAPALSPKAVQIKQKIDDALADRGLTGKASVQGIGNALTLTGKLRPVDHAALLKLLRDVPASVHIVDNIGDDDALPAPSSKIATPAPSSAPSASNSIATMLPSAAQSSNDQLKSNSRVAWANVRSFPLGADILLDGTPTGQSTPARVQLPIGVHTLTLRLDGFKDLLRPVEVSDGGTVEVRGVLRRH